MKKETKRYLRDTRLAFPVFRKDEKRFFSDFKATVSEYEFQHPECNRDELIDAYGIPKEVVTEYFCNMDPENYMTLMKRSHYLKIITATAIVLLTVLFIMESLSIYKLHKEAEEAIITEEENIIIYE